MPCVNGTQVPRAGAPTGLNPACAVFTNVVGIDRAAASPDVRYAPRRSTPREQHAAAPRRPPARIVDRVARVDGRLGVAEELLVKRRVRREARRRQPAVDPRSEVADSRSRFATPPPGALRYADTVGIGIAFATVPHACRPANSRRSGSARGSMSGTVSPSRSSARKRARPAATMSSDGLAQVVAAHQQARQVEDVEPDGSMTPSGPGSAGRVVYRSRSKVRSTPSGTAGSPMSVIPCSGMSIAATTKPCDA